MTKDELRKRIESDYHYVRDPAKADQFEIIRHTAKKLAHVLIDVLPPDRELYLALTKVEEACMHASAGIARMPAAPAPGTPEVSG